MVTRPAVLTINQVSISISFVRNAGRLWNSIIQRCMKSNHWLNKSQDLMSAITGWRFMVNAKIAKNLQHNSTNGFNGVFHYKMQAVFILDRLNFFMIVAYVN